MHTPLIHLALGLVLGAAATLSVAQASSCYSQAIPMPAIRELNILLIDLTTPQADTVVTSFTKAASAAARRHGQRFVILSFAGIALGENLRKLADQVVEPPITDAAVIEDLPIRAFQNSQRCVMAANARWTARSKAVVAMAFADGSPQRFQRSEIIYALSETLRSFAVPGVHTRLFVYSDALQHGSGSSFYGPDKGPRKIDAKTELTQLPAPVRSPPVHGLGSLKVLWWGLLVESGELKARAYRDAGMIEELRSFWTGLFAGWGVRDVQIGHELLNPRMEWADHDMSNPR